MVKYYGYVRVSTKTQNIERQVENIKKYFEKEYPQNEVISIYKEKYTGTTLNREKWQELFSKVKENDTIIFDEVSRLSRNAQEGFEVYQELYSRGVNLVFIKEPHINTSVFRDKAENKINLNTNDKKLKITENFINDLLLAVAEEQIELAFKQAQKERDLLSQRVKEGMLKTDKRIGIEKGTKLNTKKSKQFKPIILESSQDFNGSMNDKELMQHLGLSRNTFYKYKKELKQEQL